MNGLMQDEEADMTALAGDLSKLDTPAPNGTASSLAEDTLNDPPGLTPGQL